MNRSMKTAVQVFGIIVIILLCTAIMNFGLAKVLGQGYIVGKNISIKQWLDGYHSILYAVTGVALLLPLLWYIMARFIFKITSSRYRGYHTAYLGNWSYRKRNFFVYSSCSFVLLYWLLFDYIAVYTSSL